MPVLLTYSKYCFKMQILVTEKRGKHEKSKTWGKLSIYENARHFDVCSCKFVKTY